MSLTTLGYGSCNLITTIGYGGGLFEAEVEIRRRNQRFRGRRPPPSAAEQEDCYIIRAQLVNVNGDEITPPLVGDDLKVCFQDDPVTVRVLDVRKEKTQIVIEARLKEAKGYD